MSATYRFILQRWPQTQRAQAILHEELERAFTRELFPAVKRDFDNPVSNWRQKPEFYQTTQHHPKRFAWFFRVHREDDGGQHWWWVNYGTGEDGPKHERIKLNAVRAPNMVFNVPYAPLTVPPAGLGYDPSAPLRLIKKKHIEHPGIRKRDWSTILFDKYSQRGQANGFHDIIYRAGARAWARI